MPTRYPTALLSSALLLLALGWIANPTVAMAGAKVQICHLPPGNLANFHTITVSESALPAHLAHGDLAGSCFGSAEVLCDDDDACTIDAMDFETETCLADHPPVDCDDGLLCTTETCDPATGCQSAPIVCDDGDKCTVDTCNPFDGQCTGTPIDCGPLGICVAETGLCDFPCDGVTCDPIDQCHETGECVLDGAGTACLDGPAKENGTECDDGNAETGNDQCTNGVCVGQLFVAISVANSCEDTLEPDVVASRTLAEFSGLYCDGKLAISNGDFSCAPCASADFSDAVSQLGGNAAFCGVAPNTMPGVPQTIVLDDLQICARSLLTGEKWDIDFLTHSSFGDGCIDNDAGASCANATAPDGGSENAGFVSTYLRTLFVP